MLDFLPVRKMETMSSMEIAELTGKSHSHVIRDTRSMLDALKKDDSVLGHQIHEPELVHVREEKDARGYTSAFHLNKELTLTLVAGYDAKLRLAIIKRWQELEAKATPTAPVLTQAEQDVRLAILLADALNVAPSGRITMLGVALKHSAPHMLPALPSYAIDAPPSVLVSGTGSSMVTASATELLKKHGVKMSTAKFNDLLADAGMLNRCQRTSSRGAFKHFWAVTAQGERYGKNITSAHNSRETQPHWFVDCFGDLLEVVGVSA